jgi:hypothetical protein
MRVLKRITTTTKPQNYKYKKTKQASSPSFMEKN